MIPKGPIRFMAEHPVAANLLMFSLMVGGLIVASNIKLEVFPEFELDAINVAIPYPGASPEEVERGVVQVVEEAVRGIEGVKTVTSAAGEGIGSVRVELIEGTNGERARAEVESAVGRIASFPGEAERPTVTLLVMRRQVVSLVLYGDSPEATLKQLADRARDELLLIPGITQVDVFGTRRPEIRVEAPQESLRQAGLTLDRVAREVASTSVDLPAGGLRTDGGEILVRTTERRDDLDGISSVPVLAAPGGAAVALSDVAGVVDTFEDVDKYSTFNGKRAVRLQVYRSGSATALEVADGVKAYMETLRRELPEVIGLATWDDQTETLEARLDLLIDDSTAGLILVILVLGLFLEVRVAFWVTWGVPTAFLGSLVLLPLFGVSINMVSLFAFIIALGLVVDDAIVIGDNTYHHWRQGKTFKEAAVIGTREVAVPITFSVLCTMVAFMPLLLVPGRIGKIFYAIPIIVIVVLFISLIECLFIMPAHLAAMRNDAPTGFRGALFRGQQTIARVFDRTVEAAYGPFVRVVARYRYATVAFGIAILIAVAGYFMGGHMKFTFFPKVEQDVIRASATLPFGSPVSATEALRRRIEESARSTAARFGGDDIVRGVYSDVGSAEGRGGSGAGGGHLTSVSIQLVGSDQRSVTSAEFANAWRDAVGPVVGIETLSFQSTGGPGGGPAMNLQLNHTDLDVLEEAATTLSKALAGFQGVKDVTDGFADGKVQLDLTLKPEARALGITAADLARQLRSAFFGAEAVRQQRGRDELRVMVSLPKAERSSEYDIEKLLIRTPAGGELPLVEAAEITRGQSYTEIRRRDGRRIAEVTGDVASRATNANEVLNALADKTLPDLMARYPGLGWRFGGDRENQGDALGALGKGYLFTLITIFILLAIPFGSYAQPLIVMSAIPFGIVGAVLGHALHDFDLSIMSVMGLVAMTGVVVNDSLVLVDAANGYSAEGHPMRRAVCLAGIRRFRPIVLNSLTTFFGLIPMINQPSPQAKFLIPMALSLGYGVLFSTFTTLVLVPAFTLIVEDGRRFVRWVYPKQPDRGDPVTAAAPTDSALATAASASEP